MEVALNFKNFLSFWSFDMMRNGSFEMADARLLQEAVALLEQKVVLRLESASCARVSSSMPSSGCSTCLKMHENA